MLFHTKETQLRFYHLLQLHGCRSQSYNQCLKYKTKVLKGKTGSLIGLFLLWYVIDLNCSWFSFLLLSRLDRFLCFLGYNFHATVFLQSPQLLLNYNFNEHFFKVFLSLLYRYLEHLIHLNINTSLL